jgi:hypothetical protein
VDKDRHNVKKAIRLLFLERSMEQLAPIDKIPQCWWLDEVVTEEAKQDPDWRRKAKSGRGCIIAEPDSSQHAPS